VYAITVFAAQATGAVALANMVTVVNLILLSSRPALVTIA